MIHAVRRILRLIKHKLLFDPMVCHRLERKVEALSQLVRVTNDIRRVPPAIGIRRMAQLANAVWLKRVTDVLDANGIQYWLIAGTLLGGVRHGGSVPWDDDIDIGVFRADHNRLEGILKKAFCEERAVTIVKSDTMRVMQTDSSCQVDIFAFDEYHVAPDDVERLKRQYEECHRKIKTDYSKLVQRERVIINYTDEEILSMQRQLVDSFDGEKTLLMPGIEAGGNRTLVWEKSWFFPLRKIKYESFEFSAPNRPDLVLYAHYGDFMAFPQNMDAHDDIESRLTLDAYQKFEKILADNNVSVGGR